MIVSQPIIGLSGKEQSVLKCWEFKIREIQQKFYKCQGKYDKEFKIKTEQEKYCKFRASGVSTTNSRGREGVQYLAQVLLGPLEGNESVNRNEQEGQEFRQLPEAEYSERMRKVLCFRCNEQFSSDHACKNKELRVMLLEVELDDQEGQKKRKK